MKPRTIATTCLATFVLVMTGPAAHAVLLYWDLNGMTANTAVAVTGAWNGTNTFWNTASTGTGGAVRSATTNADDLFFSSGTNLTTGTVTASNNRVASSITFDDNVIITLAGPVTIGGTGTKSGIFAALTKTTATTVSGAVTLAAASTLQTGNGAFTHSGAITLGSNTLAIDLAGTGRLTVSGVVSGTGAITVSGSSTGDYVPGGLNTYSGGTTLNTGSLTAVGASSVGPDGAPTTSCFGTGVLTLAGGQLRSGTGASYNIGNTIAISGDSTFYTIAGEKSLSFSGPVTLSGGNRTLTSTVGTNVAGTSAIFNGNIGDAGATLGIIKAGLGNITLNGNNTYGGNTTIGAGMLSIGSKNALPGWDTNGRFSVASGATLAVQNGVIDTEVATMLATTNFATDAVLGFDTVSGNRTYALNLSDTAQGSLGLSKVGANMLSLNGTNTYTGITNIRAGALSIGTTSSLPGWNTNGRFAVTSGAALAVQNTVSDAEITTLLGGTNLAAGAFFGFDTSAGDRTYADVLADHSQGALNLQKYGPNALTLSGANTYTGSTNVTEGTLALTGNRTVTPGALSIGSIGRSGTLNIQGDLPLATGNNFIGNGAGGTGIVNQSSGNVSFGAATVLHFGSAGVSGNENTATYNLSGGTLGGATTTGLVSLGVNSFSQNTFNQTGGELYLPLGGLHVGRNNRNDVRDTSNTFSQSGGTALVGTLIVGGNNDTAINAAGVDGTVNLSGGTFSATNFSHFAAGRDNNSSINISGTALVTLPAFPTTRGTGSTATITFDGGTLSPAAASTAYMGGLNNAYIKAGGARLDVALNKDITVSQALLTDPVSTGGGLTKAGAGVLTLSGASTYSGATALTAGTLAIAGTGSLAGTSGLSVSSGAKFLNLTSGTLTLGTTGTLSLANQSSIGGIFGSTIAAPGAASASGIVNLLPSGAFTSGNTYTLLSATGGLDGATYQVHNPTDFTFTTAVTATSVQITPTTATPLAAAYWTGGLPGSSRIWAASNGSTASNWASDSTGTPTPLVPGTPAALVFNDASPAPGNLLDMTLGSDMAIGGMTVTSANNLILLKDGVSALTIGSSGLTVNPGASSVTLNPDLVVGAAQSWINNSSNPLTLGGAVSSTGTNTLTINGTGATTFANFVGGGGGLTVLTGNTTLNTASPTVAQTWTNNGLNPLTVGTLNNGNALLTIGGTGITNIANLAGGSGGIAISSATTNIASATLQASQTWSSNSLDTGLNIGNVNNNGHGLTLGGTGISQVTGIIGGTGTLTKSGTGTLTLDAANTYSGATVVNGGSLVMANSNALGTTASGTTQSGASEIRLTGGITIAEPISINGGGISNQGTIRNVTGDNTWSATVTQAAQSRINSDAGTLTLSAPTAVSGNNLSLVLGGAGNISIPGTLALGTGGLSKDGTGTVTISGSNTYGGVTKIDSGTLIVAGSNPATGAITAGNSAVNPNATINILNGATLTGSTVSAGTVSGSSGAVNLTGGSLLLSAPETTDSTSFGVANDSYGAFKMTAGTFTQSRLMFGGTGGSTGTGAIGVGHISGGTVNTNGWFILARAGASTGVLTITDGTINHANASQVISIGLQGSGRAELNVAGGLIDNTGRNVTFSGGTGGTFHWTGTGVVNMNAGTLLTNAIVYDANAASANASSYVNFNGGTLKASSASTTFLPAFTPGGTGINQVTVNGAFGSFAGGAVIDTNGFDNTIGADLLAPSGDGVTSLNLDNVGSGYIGAPAVRILNGDNSPSTATAYASVGTDPSDLATFGKLTGVVITNPGNITGIPTVNLIGGGGSGATISVASTGANTSGGLTKLGAGALTLTGTNTYTGPTSVSAGTLTVNGALANTSTTISDTGTLKGSGAIAGPVSILSGGTLASGNSIESLTTGALTLAGGSTFAYEIDNDAAAAAAGDLTAVTGNLTISVLNNANLTLSELGAGSWSLGEKLTLLSYSGTWNGGLFNYGSTLADDSTFNFSGSQWTFNYNDTIAGSNFTGDLTNNLPNPSFVTMTVVPEPSTCLLGSLGLLVLLRRRR